MKFLTLRDHRETRARPAIMADRPAVGPVAALLPDRDEFDPTHPLGCRRRIADRIVFDKLLQVLRFGCSYQGIADSTCSATTIRDRRDEWIKLMAPRRGCGAASRPSRADDRSRRRRSCGWVPAVARPWMSGSSQQQTVGLSAGFCWASGGPVGPASAVRARFGPEDAIRSEPGGPQRTPAP